MPMLSVDLTEQPIVETALSHSLLGSVAWIKYLKHMYMFT